MKRTKTILSSVLALISCHQDKSDREGHIYDEDGVTVIDLHGSWHQMGRQYAIMLESSVPVVAQYGRAETREVAFYTTPGYCE